VAIIAETSGAYTVSGELCATASEQRAGKSVQVLLHGAAYNYDYWDLSRFDGAEYSYSRDVAASGFATFAYDALGSGNSSHPPSDLLTIQSAAQVAHQIVRALRAGSIGGVRFGKVILVGHSLGAVVAWEEAISYRDVDGLIVTGAAHSLSSRFQAAKTFYPAVNDPAFAASGLDPGYLTTRPGVRTGLFYSDPDSDPVGSIADEVFKDVVPAVELMSAIPIIRSVATLAIQVPVLIILGSDDLLTCGPNPQGGSFDCSSAGAVVAQEARFYSPQARMAACVIPGAGHAISLSMNHRLQAIDAVAWSREFIDQPGGARVAICPRTADKKVSQGWFQNDF
jgi:pimeloyl-ACP methyl ester carboxylesterase